MQGLGKMTAQSAGRTLKSYKALGGLQVVQVPQNETVAQALKRYRASGLVEFAEPDYKLHALALPNDPQFVSGAQWSLRNSTSGRDIHAVEAWDTATSASNIIVAVIDTGIRYTHEDLAANMWRNPGEIPGNGFDDDGNGIVDDVHGINTIFRTGDPMDDGDHGTHVAGIIGAVGNNGKGIAGVAWNVKLMACKFLDSNGDGDTSDVIEALDYARRMGAHVVNASFGGPDYSDALYTAIQNARAAGMIVVAAAGNESMNLDEFPSYPACYSLDNVVSVGGTSRSDNLDLGYSNYGANQVDLCAPGSSIYSTWGSGDSSYLPMSGTSMATPHVAGAIALMKARFPTMSHTQIITRLLENVDVLPGLQGRCRTGGRLNLAKALGPNPAANFSASSWSGEPPFLVTFNNESLGDVRSLHWNFGDGSPESTNAQPAHTFVREGEFKVRLMVVGTNSKTNSIEQTIRVVSNYKIEPANYAWIEPTGLTRLLLSDNGVSQALPLTFPFSFYGSNYSAIHVGANGVLGFNSDGLNATDNTVMPNSGGPNGIIAPYWDNLNPAAGGSVYAGTIGTAPNRRFVATWVNVQRAASTIVLTFQAILEEATGDIIFQYREIDRNRAAGRSATIGIESATGESAAMYTHNGSPYLLENRMALRAHLKKFRYLLVGQEQLTLQATAGATSGARGLIGLENSGTAELNWNVSTQSPWLVITNSGGSLVAGEAAELTITLAPSAATLQPGTYETSLEFSNASDGLGNKTVPVIIQIEPAQAQIEFLGASSNLFSGGFGGPFAPGPITVHLRNSGSNPVSWASTAHEWLHAEPASGTLPGGETISILVGLTPAANTISAGSHDGAVHFYDASTPQLAVGVQLVRLQVNSHLEKSGAVLVNGEFRAELAAPSPGEYAVEVSNDLATWETLTTAMATDGSVKFNEIVSAEGRRFYRLRLL